MTFFSLSKHSFLTQCIIHRLPLLGKPPQTAVYHHIKGIEYYRTIEIIRSCIAVHGGYYYSVQKWGNVPALFEPVWYVLVRTESDRELTPVKKGA